MQTLSQYPAAIRCHVTAPYKIIVLSLLFNFVILSSSFLACNSYDCVAPYVGIILHRGWFWAKSAASGSVRWCCFRSGWTVIPLVSKKSRWQKQLRTKARMTRGPGGWAKRTYRPAEPISSDDCWQRCTAQPGSFRSPLKFQSMTC